MKLTLERIIDWVLSILAAILLVAYTKATRFPFINPDESNSIKYARMGVFKMIRELAFDAHLPGYPLLLKIVNSVVGLNQSSLYWVNAALLFILVYKLSVSSSSLFRKIVMALFVVLNPFVLETFGEIRPYALLFTSLMLVLLEPSSEDGAISGWTLPLALSHHLGFAAAGLSIGAEALKRKRNRQPLPWAWISVILAILPLVLLQTIQIASEGRYVVASDRPSGYGLGARLVQLSRLFVGGAVFEEPRYSKTWIIFSATLVAVTVSLLLGHGKTLWTRISVASLPLLSVFIIHASVLNFQYFTGAIAVLILLVVTPVRSSASIDPLKKERLFGVPELLVPLGMIFLSLPASLSLIHGKETFYKVNYLDALAVAEHEDYSEILLANGGVRGAALTAFELIVPKPKQTIKVTDLFSDFYTGEGVTPAVIRARLTGWALHNPGKKALLIYSSAPLPDLYVSHGVRVVAGPWQTSPGDYVSVIIEPGS